MRTDDQTVAALEAPHAARLEPAVRPTSVASVESPAVRVRHMVDRHYDAVWRSVRFLGVPDAHAEDVAQQTFCVAARKLDAIEPGAELPFLLATAWRVASEHRRAASRRPVTSASDAEVESIAGSFPSPEQLLDQKRARVLLQAILDAMPVDLRMVFVLYEIEELTLPEIASATGVRLGTVTSRLRRAREEFQSIVKRTSAAAGRARGGSK
jgi:RNA polymerase sigma-70 factor (ECF subfamily)